MWQSVMKSDCSWWSEHDEAPPRSVEALAPRPEPGIMAARGAACRHDAVARTRTRRACRESERDVRER